MSATQVFLEYQPLLQRIALRMVGCVKDAEDLVQDTFEKWLKIDHSKIQNAKAYLITTLKNKCINFINSFRKNKELTFGSPMDLFKTKYEEIDFRLFDFETNLSAGIGDLLQKMTLPEFSILLLKEGFAFDYPELTEIFGQKIDNCRQLLSRAKKKKQARIASRPLNQERRKQITAEITAIYRQGNMQALVAYLQKEWLNS